MGQLFHNKGIEGVLHARDLCLPFVHIHVLLNTPQFKWWWQLISVELQPYRSLTGSNEFHLRRTKRLRREGESVCVCACARERESESESICQILKHVCVSQSVYPSLILLFPQLSVSSCKFLSSIWTFSSIHILIHYDSWKILILIVLSLACSLQGLILTEIHQCVTPTFQSSSDHAKPD